MLNDKIAVNADAITQINSDLQWKSMSLSGMDTVFSTEDKQIKLSNEVITAHEIIVNVMVSGASELTRNLLLIPGKVFMNGSYIGRGEQIATVSIGLSGSNLIFSCFKKVNLSPYINSISYR